MKNPQTRSAWLSLALILLVVSVPAHADSVSDLFGLFFQASTIANNSGLTFGEKTSLATKVIAAIADVQKGHDNAARGVLGAFINEVDAMERNGRLTPADAAALVNSAQAIRDGL
jgi:hypothetical protein